MISIISGKLVERLEGELIISVSGVGFRVFVPTSLLSSLPPVGEEVRLRIHTYLREDQIALYGFLQPEEVQVFRALLGVSRIGPQVAIQVLSMLSPGELVESIQLENTSTLKRVPGIGKKTAQRIILELKDKFDQSDFVVPSGTGESVPEDLITGLVNLGYSAQRAQEVLSQVVEEQGSQNEEQLLRLALKKLGNN